jgi:hypothetical protein
MGAHLLSYHAVEQHWTSFAKKLATKECHTCQGKVVQATIIKLRLTAGRQERPTVDQKVLPIFVVTFGYVYSGKNKKNLL